jgi:hypothetical protein
MDVPSKNVSSGNFDRTKEDLNTKPYKSVVARGISSDTCKTYKAQLGGQDSRGERMIFGYHDKDGFLVGAKTRTPEKEFFTSGAWSDTVLFGQNLFPKGGKYITITEGEYDGKPNPHAWMSLSSGLTYVDNIRDAFVQHDPENAAIYVANAAAYKQQITDTIAPLAKQIMQLPADKRWLVSCEGAFSYLIRDFEMQELYLWPINAGQQGTPQQVRKVIDDVRANDIPAVFCESTVSQSPAQQVARETDAKYGGVLYVDSLTQADGAVPTYIDLLRVTIETIATGLIE